MLLAHVGHWAIWALYAVPVIVVLTSVALTITRERRARRHDGEL